MTTPGAPRPRPKCLAADGILFKSLVGVFFMYGSRGFGLLLTFALIGKLSIADYGLYALAFTFATILGPPLDFPWNVRAMRESDDEFARERASRFLVGATLFIAGVAVHPGAATSSGSAWSPRVARSRSTSSRARTPATDIPTGCGGTTPSGRSPAWS